MDSIMIPVVAFIALFVVLVIFCSWVEIDKKRRKKQGLPRRKYGGLLDAEQTSTTITYHSDGKMSVSETYTYPKDDD